MRRVAEHISSADHRVAVIVYHKKETAISGLWDDYALIFSKKTLVKDQMGTTGGHNTGSQFLVSHFADFIGMNSSTVHNNFCFHLEFLTRINCVHTNCACDFTFRIFNKFNHLNVVSKSGPFLAGNVIINSCSEQRIEAHTTVAHLCFSHDSAIAVVKLVQVGVLFPQSGL